MDTQNQLLDSQELLRLNSTSLLQCLLDGLERQKEDLGPIAIELIELLQNLGVDVAPSTEQPQAKPES